uniref:Protein CIP2A n=1 Tax=Stomoxys calcitrans TaxID=35570 RepID=A0A1I8P1G6_STOCA
MNSRKNNTSNSSSESANAISYVRDFSVQAAIYRNNKSEESLVLLNRSASLLSTAIQPQYFAPGNLEISKFYIDLHAVMGSLSADSDALWACVAVLQHCSKNLEARAAIVDEYRFIPLLTFLLKRTQPGDKQQRVLTLLQELTFGIKITWEEPYIVVLLEQLVQIVYQASEEGEELHAQLALSTLINMCYKNFVVLFLFLRSVNISSFSRRIQNYGMLANKMLIILSEDIHSPDQKELHLFLRSCFAAVDECIKTWNVPHLRHIVEFLKDSKAHSGLHQAMLSYQFYFEDIEKVLDRLETRASMDDSNEDTRKHQQICLGLLFELMEHIMDLSGQVDEEGKENAAISLDSNIPRIFELLCNWLQSAVCGVQAINLLDSLVRLAKKESIAPRISRDPSVVIQLINSSEKPETSPLQTAAVLRLLVSLLHQTKTEKLILSKITESYFDKILAPLLAIKPEMPDNSLSKEEIEKSIFCLLLLINFTDIAKKAYFEKCCTLLQLPQIQHALARAMISGGERVCSAVFQISQFEHFPQTEVAKHISKLNSSINQMSTCSAPSGDQWRNLNAILKSHKTFVSKELEERLHALIDVISNAERNNQLNNVATSQIMELFNYKIKNLNAAEKSMQKRLEDASNEITQLTQRINFQNAELEKYHTMNFELHINQESLQTQCKDLKHQKDNLKRNMTELMKKLSEQSETLQISEKRLAVKVSEMIVLQKSYNDLKDQLQQKTEELEKLHTASKESSLRIDKLKKTITAYEVDMKEKTRHIEEKERELAKTQKLLEEQRDAKKKCDGVITVLESQLQEKNEQIRSYELELSETEELRKTIMSLMESKKPKRK